MSDSKKSFRTAPIALIISIIATAVIYCTPQAQFIAYPLLLLSTLVHELGHGFTAMLVGADFEQFMMYADGSGVAYWSGDVGRISRALISAGGLIGPAIIAGLLFTLGRYQKGAKILLWFLAAILTLSLVLVVRNMFGVFFVSCVGLITAYFASFASPVRCQWYCYFIGSQLGLSVFSRSDYLFTPVAQTSAGDMPSDVAHMAQALLLPYWFWGAVCGLISVGILGFGVYISFRKSE